MNEYSYTQKESFLDKAIKLVACVAGVMVLGWLVGMAGGATQGYTGLVRPSFTPPDIVFSIVWPTLYALMGVSLYLTISAKTQNNGVRIASFVLFALQLALNLLWVPVFFKLRAYLIAFIILAMIDALVSALIIVDFKINKWSAILLIPYLAWIIFATYLNISIVALNA